MDVIQLREQVKELQNEMKDNGRSDVAEMLACASLNLRIAHERIIGEGKTGDQTSSRKYAGRKETEGPEIQSIQKIRQGLLDEENSHAASKQQEKNKRRAHLDKTVGPIPF